MNPPETTTGGADARLSFELGVWLLALKSYFDARNHPFPDSSPVERVGHDWVDELRIARVVLRDCSNLTTQLGIEKKEQNSLLLDDEFAESTATDDARGRVSNGGASNSLFLLREALHSANSLCKALLEARPIIYGTWRAAGEAVIQRVYTTNEARSLIQSTLRTADATLQSALIELTRDRVNQVHLGGDLLLIFRTLARMLEWLRMIGILLERDQPLKRTLPIFTLIHEDAKRLVEFIEKRAMRDESLSGEVADSLDATGYAIKMELRKVFSHELLTLASQRQAPPIKVKVETAHGLLRNCFQQSTVGLAQLFDATLDGANLFGSFQTLLDQSLTLRSDLWKLLLMVLRAEKERDVQPITPLMQELKAFGEGSLRYLMYKDWETCERFIEEVAAARGAVELAPVLHRFGTYLRTLHGQVNMRAVLANHPFEATAVEV